MAAFDYFLRIDGIPGESADAKHKGEIEVETFSWGESQAAAGSSGSGGGAGRVTMHDLHFTATVSKASPMLMLACAAGRHLKSAVLSARRTAKQPADFLTFSLSDVLVSGHAITAAEDGPPTDSVSLNFGRIQVEYKAQKADGSLGASTKAGWDVKTNKQV